MQYTLSILVENQVGVPQNFGLFSAEDLILTSPSATNTPGVSRITIVAKNDEYVVEQLENSSTSLYP